MARSVLVAVGVLGLGLGAYVLVDSVALRRLPGLALWIAGAIVLHDAVISPLVFGLGVLTRRAGHRVAGSVVVTVQATIVLGSLMTLIVLPAIAAQRQGPRNPTVLPLDYAANLGLFWLILAVACAAVSLWFYLRTRRANQRPSRIQS
ncbi:hypothetical protein [Cryobacterium sp.]|uniref:hypothetical protein n=1 Tax=Cryobacterium sp. TaxID=1926290 RepID=UPI002602A5AB|nr:hypothetical protein [Cryobacterium sp.]